MPEKNRPVVIDHLPKILTALQQRIGPSLSALLLAILFSSVAILLINGNPILAFAAIFEGAFGNPNALAEVLVKTSPLLLAGLGTAFAFRCQMWNIGAEGQMLMGALAASSVSLALPGVPGFLGIILALTAAFVVGGIWAGIAGYLKVRLGASEIINTIMLNYIAVYVISYLVRGPLKDTASYVPLSPMFAPQYWLPQILPPTRLHIGILFAILAALVIFIVLWYTPFGFRVIAVGSNPKAARLGGISVAGSMVLAMFISGGLAGLAGAGEVLGLYRRLLDGVSAGYGFSSMAIAILGGLHPIGVSIFAFFFAALRVGADHMQRQLGVPAALVHLIEGMVIIFVQGRYILPGIVAGLQKKVRMIKQFRKGI